MKKPLVTELAAVFLATCLANLLLSPHSPGWVGLQPHPFLIPICLIASRYGSPPAAVFTLLLLLGYELATRANPLQPPHSGLWASCILAAALVGSLFDQFRHRQHQLEADLTRQNHELARLQSQNQVLEEAVGELRGRILAAGQTFGSLYEMARRLTTLSQEQLYPASLELACRQTEASQAHFWLRDPDGLLRAVAHHPPDVRPRSDPQQSGLVRRALDTGKLATAYECAELAGPLEPLVVVPLVGDQGVMGVLTFEHLPFRRFHPATLAELESIGDWTARALAQVERFREGEQRLAVGQATQQKLLEKLGEVVLRRADLPLWRTLVEPMTDQLLLKLLDSDSGELLRSNLLMLLSQPAPELERFVHQEIGWVRLIHRDLHGLSHQGREPELKLLLTYLRRALDRRRRQLLRAQALLRPLPDDRLEELLRLPVAWPGQELSPGLRQSVVDWAGPALAETLAATVSLGPKLDGHITLEEQLLDFLGRPDTYLVCATLHCLGKLGVKGEPAPGSPAAVAGELAESGSARVREAAACCLTALGL